MKIKKLGEEKILGGKSYQQNLGYVDNFFLSTPGCHHLWAKLAWWFLVIKTFLGKTLTIFLTLYSTRP
jgi:hypothetical protein